MIRTIADLNAANEEFWAKRSEKFSRLVGREYGKQFLKETFFARTRIEPRTFEEAFDCLRREEPLEELLIRYSDGLEKKLFALEPRRKDKNGLAQRDLVKRHGSRPGTRFLSTKELWRLFLPYLRDAGLNPQENESMYTYDGARAKRIKISFRRFKNTVSEVCPRKKRSNSDS